MCSPTKSESSSALKVSKNHENRHGWLRCNGRSTMQSGSSVRNKSETMKPVESRRSKSKTIRGSQRIKHRKYERECLREQRKATTNPIVVHIDNAHMDAPPLYYVANVRYVSFAWRWINYLQLTLSNCAQQCFAWLRYNIIDQQPRTPFTLFSWPKLCAQLIVLYEDGWMA